MGPRNKLSFEGISVYREFDLDEFYCTLLKLILKNKNILYIS